MTASKFVVMMVVVLPLIIFSKFSFALQADTQYIPRDKYFETVLKEINSAKSSVQVFMYLVSLSDPESEPARLVGALIAAKNRGVEVQVVLDQNFEDGNKNEAAYKILKENHVAVFFDEPENYTHAKAVVIDHEEAIFGSTNWSRSALTRNHEVSAVVHSKEFVRELLKDLSEVKLQESPGVLAPTVDIPGEFLTDPRFLGGMVTRDAERAFDVYLYLLKEYDGNPEAKVSLKYDELAGSLGIEKMSHEEYRRQIIKILKKLEDEYGLIEFRPRYAGDAEVILKVRAGDNAVKIPENYWAYGWDRALPFAGKSLLLINLSERAASKHPPSWSLSVQALSEKYHVSGWFINEGTTALRRANLVEVEYAPLDREGNETHWPSVYTLNPLYDPKELSRKVKVLEARYGQAKLARAKSYAELVYEDSDVNGIETFIELEDKYGAEVVKKAADVIRLKSPSNPKRTLGYWVATVRGMGEAQK